jgi:peptidoglycan-associated lipoprotein
MKRWLAVGCALCVMWVLSGCQTASVKKSETTGTMAAGSGAAGDAGAGATGGAGRATTDEFKQAVSTGDVVQQGLPAGRKFVSPGDLGAEVAKIFTPVHFAFDSYAVDRQNASMLKGITAYLLAHPDMMVVLEGHCDERGTEAYNLALGEHRALSVRKLLIMGGVSPKRLFTSSYGATKPVDATHSEDAWTRNRRCEFLLSPK